MAAFRALRRCFDFAFFLRTIGELRQGHGVVGIVLQRFFAVMLGESTLVATVGQDARVVAKCTYALTVVFPGCFGYSVVQQLERYNALVRFN